MLGGNILDEVPKLAEALPPFPSIVMQLLDRLRDEDSSLDVLVRLARNDPVISSNILASANHIRRLRLQSDLSDSSAAALILVTRFFGEEGMSSARARVSAKQIVACSLLVTVISSWWVRITETNSSGNSQCSASSAPMRQ